MSADPYVLKVDTTLQNGESITIPFTYTITGANTTTTPIIGTFKSSGTWTTAGTGGTWTGTVFYEQPDMTDWSADDILDWFAKDLAKRCPA